MYLAVVPVIVTRFAKGDLLRDGVNGLCLR
jgi:hypothetical protein